MSHQLLSDYLSRCPENVTKNTRIESLEESKTGKILHISANTHLKEMVPRISARQLPTEDRTTPRVVGAPTLYGCILAYQSVASDYMNSQSRTKFNATAWRNGYRIYSISYEYCVKPNKNLVPDAVSSDETWLVNYSEETKVYKPLSVGRIFCTEILFKPRIGQLPQFRATLFIEVTDSEGIYFSANHKLDKGYWRVQTSIQDNQSWKHLSWKDDKDVVVESITDKEWLDNKRSVADLLSLQEKNVPAYIGW